MGKNYELELYKLITDKDELGISYADEFGWVDDLEFCVWVSNRFFKDFMDGLTNIFGCNLYDDGGIEATLQSDCVCIDLYSALEIFDLDLERVFPKSKYWH